MHVHLSAKQLVPALAMWLGVQGMVPAATIPAGVQLADKQELTRNNGSEPETLDPALAQGVPANNVLRELFEGLTAKDGTGQVVPGVAQSWKQNDPTTWTFVLRKDARWSNGEAVTAADFVYGMQRFVDPKTASEYASSFGVFLKSGAEIVAGKLPPSALGVKALDAYTLEIKTPYPVAFLPELLANTQLGPVHKATVEKFGKEWTKPGNMVGNGAFVLKEWQVNSKIVLTPNPNYWDKRNVQLTRFTYLPVEDSNTDIKLYESGENDWVYQLPPGTYDKYKTQYPKDIRNAPMLALRYYSYNVKDPLLKDVRVRKALSMVIDRETLAAKVTADGQLPAYGLMVKGTAGADVSRYDWAAWPMDKRVAEAQKLLKEAGVAEGTTVKFAYNTDVYHKKMAIYVASEWRNKLGLNTEMEAMEFKVLLKRRNAGEFQIARNGWIADYNDATTFLTLVQCDSDQNSQRNCNRKVEDLIDQGNFSKDPQQRHLLLTRAAQLVMEDYPMIPLLQYTVPRLVKPYVGGYTDTNSLDRYRGKDLYIIKH